ncbi:myosin light chain kinase, smooth muscle [Colossoma macropomum]|uniref:myosin light chain kinase, smooth muscle n=1 Tax=Colossoma macropomum TaxID=42526 RepID=UPI001864ACF3|nr:myosin light chain kinase, smooth muscle [Colossoma macropomum]
MSVCGGQKRYVSTLRIQLSAPTSGGGTLSNADTPTGTLKNGERADSSVNEGDAPRFLKPLQDCLVDEGSDITLRGVITGRQPIRVSWFHNGEVVLYGKSSFTDGEVKLVITECLPEDAGAYTCVAENSAGKTSSSSAVCVKETVVAIRHSHTYSSGPPARGLKNGSLSSPQSDLDDSSVFRGPDSPQTASPQTQSPTHRKEVTAKRRSSSGTVVPLQVFCPRDQVEVRGGQSACLSCEFKGSYPVVSCWIHNRKEVLEGCRYSIESSSDSSTLVISDARPEDSGRYTLVIRDRKSSTQHTLTLSVTEQPQPPASCPVVCVLSQQSVVLSWSGPCYDGGSAVTGYVVEVQSVGSDHSDHWTELSAHCRSTSLRVSSGLQPQGQYRFRVRACNTVGVSEPSQESQVIKMDSPGKPHEEKIEEFVTVTIDDVHKVTDHYNVLEKLGVGKFGQVFRLTHKETGRVCAGKFYKGRRAKEREAAKKEIELMNFLHHPKLVQCLAAYDNKPEIVMVMEFIAGGELFERIVDDNFEHTEPSSVGYMRQILQGIQYMHQQNIIHLDLKPENIVCVDKTGIQVKIIDFGLAAKLDPSNPVKVMHGTPEFVAPEVINYEPIYLATDMWSIGVICYILLSGESPFLGDSDSETLAHVTAARWEFDEESFEDITDQAKDFISSLLHKDVRRRMSCEEALAHSWMAAFESADPSTAKNLSKDKMKKFLARQKWKKTGKAVLALKRMAMLSKTDNSTSLPSPVDDTEQALKTLEKKMQSKPEFTKTPFDLSAIEESTAEFFCKVTGYPDPEVVWLRDGVVLEEKEGSVQVEYEEDGTCVLTLESVSMQQSGTYSCRATNVHGEALCSAKLTVVEQEEDTD